MAGKVPVGHAAIPVELTIEPSVDADLPAMPQVRPAIPFVWEWAQGQAMPFASGSQ
jgi:hypothetical protein